MPDSSQPAFYESSLPKQIAVAIAAGGRLVRVEPDDRDGRLRFIVDNIPPDFELRLARDEIQISGAKVIASMEMVLTLINAHQRRGGRR
jgi:hypothetical protein